MTRVRLSLMVLLFVVVYGGMMWAITHDINSEYEEKQRITLNECNILMTFAEDRRDTLKVLSSKVGDEYVCINLMAKEMK